MKLDWDFSELENFANKLADQKLLDFYLKKATKEMSKIFLDMLFDNTPMKTGELAGGWLQNGNLQYKVVQTAEGFEVTFTNKVPYAVYVNDGHRVKNRKDSPYYKVKHRTVPYYSGGQSAYFVYGHFFVEKTIVQLTDGSHKLDNIIYHELEKWLGRCVSGK